MCCAVIILAGIKFGGWAQSCHYKNIGGFGGSEPDHRTYTCILCEQRNFGRLRPNLISHQIFWRYGPPHARPPDWSLYYRKSGNFIVKIFSWSIEATKIKITKLKHAHASMRYGVVPTKIFLHEIFPTKISLHENFWIYGISFCLVGSPVGIETYYVHVHVL